MSEIVAVYEYRDENGALLFASVRFSPKTFRQGRPNGDGGLIWSMEGVRRVPYRLPEVLRTANAGGVVWIVEGEKDADRLATLGLTATTNAGGAGKWLPAFADHLRGCHAVILPDNDGPGRKHAQQVAGSLRGKAKSIRIVQLPGLPVHGDVSDFLDGHDLDDLFAAVRETKEWTAPKAEANQPALLLARLRAVRRHRRAERARDRTTDDGAWTRRVQQAKAIKLTQVAVLLGLGRSEGLGHDVRVRCPFHDDQHPSLLLNDEKGLWYCGPCGEGGDGIGLYMRVKEIKFADAVKALAPE